VTPARTRALTESTPDPDATHVMKGPEIVELPKVISVDDHVVESPDMFKRWLPSHLRDRAPSVERVSWEMVPGNRQAFRPATSGPKADFWRFEDLWQGIARGMASVGMDNSDITRVPMSFDEMRPGCYDPKARLADLDLVGIERSMCFPNQVRFCGQVFLWMRHKEFALACVKAYNDWIVEEWCGDSGGRLLPVCLIPMWDPVAAAAEVRRNAARGVRAVAFSELPAQLDLPSIHDRNGYWLPFFDACNETGTVVCCHIGSSSTIASTSADAPLGVSVALSTINSQLALADWLISGLFARYDNLKLALSESQIGWMPFMFERVDRIWRQGNPMAELPDVSKTQPGPTPRTTPKQSWTASTRTPSTKSCEATPSACSTYPKHSRRRWRGPSDGPPLQSQRLPGAAAHVGGRRACRRCLTKIVVCTYHRRT
jgi:hypothetical protein